MKVFDAGKTRMIGLPYGEKTYDDMLSRFHLIPERIGRTDGQTNGQTDKFAISITRVSILTRDKNTDGHCKSKVILFSILRSVHMFEISSGLVWLSGNARSTTKFRYAVPG